MLGLYVVLYALAVICFFVFAVFNERAWHKVNLLGLGVFFWALIPLIQTIQKL